MSNRGFKFLSALFVALMFQAPPVFAIERAGSVGISFTAPIRLRPDFDDGDRVYEIDLGYFLKEQWAALLSWDIGLDGSKRVGLGVGPQLFVFPEAVLNPYLVAKFLYDLDPKNDLGWRFALGAEWNLVKATGIDNLRLYGEAGVSQLFIDGGPNLLNLDLLRVGVGWNF